MIDLRPTPRQLCAQLGGDFLSESLTSNLPAHSFPSDAICKRRPVGYAGLWFRGNFAFGWFTDLPDRPRVLLVQPPRARPRPSPQPRVAPVRQPRSSLSQRLRALPPSPPRARLFAQRRAPPSRQLYASLARWHRASPSLLPRASPAAQLRAGLSPRRQALLARPRLRDPWPLAWPF